MSSVVETKRKEGIFTLLNAGTQSPLVLDSPHSGKTSPNDFNTIISDHDLRGTEDIDVDVLFDPAITANTIPFLKAEFPRSYIDVNRAEDDIDLTMIEGDWPYQVKTSSRSHNGIGLIRKLCDPDTPMYEHKLSPEDVENRINTYYHNYHNALDELITSMHDFYGQVWHINCHSMPSSSAPVATAGPVIHPTLAKADMVLGDRDGTSCSLEFTYLVRDILKNLGYKVVLNNPYKGLEIVRRHGRPHAGFHSLQLEINRAIYIDEDSFEYTKHFEHLQNDLSKMVNSVIHYCQSKLINLAAD